MITDHKGNTFETLGDMCEAYDMSRALYYVRQQKGWSLEEILTTPLKKVNKPVTDYKGNKYPSEEKMCEYYGINQSTYRFRIKKGWTQEKALTNQTDVIMDHLGNIFKTKKEMCEYHHVNRATYSSRIKAGKSIEEALRPDEKAIIKDHYGNVWNSQKAMCLFYGVDQKAYRSSIKAGKSLKEALTPPCKRVQDHLGKHYENVEEMCQAYGIKPATYYKRKEKGWSLEKALTYKEEVIGPNGEIFQSKKEMCEAYQIDIGKYNSRIKAGMSPLEAASKGSFYECTDYLGNIYKSTTEMCQHYNISLQTYKLRTEKYGWSQKRALTTPIDYIRIERLGEENTNKLGQHMKIVEYERADSIVVEFDDGTRQKTAYSYFKNGSTGCYPKLKRDRLGETKMLSCGMMGTIVEYVNQGKIVVRFEDGRTVTCRYSQFQLGSVQPPSMYHVGEEKVQSGGLMASITELRNSHDIDITFFDGVVVQHRDYISFCKGQIMHPDLKHGKVFYGFKKNKIKNHVLYQCECGICGMRDILSPTEMVAHHQECHTKHILNKSGLHMDVVETAKDVCKITFEDGTLMEDVHQNIDKIENVSHPTLKTNGAGKLLSFTTQPCRQERKPIKVGKQGNLYRCTCDLCGYTDLLTPAEMVAHYKECHTN